MAGHSQFANIKHRKGAQDAKRAKVFTKLVREIITSVKVGGPDPDGNPRLRAAMSAARVQNLPKDRIEAAISKGSSTNEGDDFVEMRYEGYAPGGIAIIVDALTDNRNRTASDVRSAFTKSGGNLGETGSVNFMFDRIGLICYKADKISAEQILEAAIEAGANDVESDENIHSVVCDIESLNDVREYLVKKFNEPESSNLTWKAHNYIKISDLEQAEKLMRLIDALEDSDDVQYVSGNYQFTPDVLTKL